VKTEITEIDWYPTVPSKGHIGFVSFSVNGEFHVAGLAVYVRPDGRLRVQYPERTLRNGRRIPLLCPLNDEVRKAVESVVEETVQEVAKKEINHERTRGK